LVLPPVIYMSAVAMSWREVRLNLGPISLLAVGCVVFTTAAIAAAAHWLLGLVWPIGFVLGQSSRRRIRWRHRRSPGE
jgi:NhaP-type Na+/H+ or K+/H+ antiporter